MAHLEREGFRVLRNGWPDFLAIRKVGATWDVWGIEVKSGKDAVSEPQKKMHRAFKAARIMTVFIARLTSDNQVRLSMAPEIERGRGRGYR